MGSCKENEFRENYCSFFEGGEKGSVKSFQVHILYLLVSSNGKGYKDSLGFLIAGIQEPPAHDKQF